MKIRRVCLDCDGVNMPGAQIVVGPLFWEVSCSTLDAIYLATTIIKEETQ